MEPPVGYGVTDRSIFPESRFGVNAHPSFPNREPPGLEIQISGIPPHEGAGSASPVVLTEIPLGVAKKGSSRQAISNARGTICADRLSIWASARTNRQFRCGEIHPAAIEIRLHHVQ